MKRGRELIKANSAITQKLAGISPWRRGKRSGGGSAPRKTDTGEKGRKPGETDKTIISHDVILSSLPALPELGITLMQSHRWQLEAMIPDTSQAEYWLSPFVFLFKGETWEIKPNGEIAPARLQGVLI